jgi:ABC-type multidrug transport system fused ATPase/permease subunit
MLTISIDMLRVIAVAVVPPLAVMYVAVVFGLAFRFHVVAIAALPTIVYLIYRIFSYGQQLMDSLQMINGSLAYLRNVLDYEEQAQGGEEVARGGAPFVLHREIRFDRVCFAYEGGTDVLHDLTFTIPRGTMLGIIGPSGAGKTTTVDLILRLLEPKAGSISLDGVDSRTIDLSDWRKKIAYVSQDFFLINDTVRNNIKFYDDSITDDEVWESARLAHVDVFIKERPEGLDTLVGERGIALSAGQRQRLTIARALARKPEVLILDEATSALDAESEGHIQRMLQELKGKITVIIIAHRLSTIVHTDTLIVLDGGKVVETGDPKQLLKDTDSYFYKVSTINA